MITLEHIYFSYDKNTPFLLEDISLEIKKGDYIAIVGPNGAGKTTLIKIILELLEPLSGKISIEGEKKKGFFGYIQQKTQTNDIFFPATVREIVEMGLLNSSKKQKENIDPLLTKLGIIELKNKAIHELSGGQYQKVLLARALIHQPEVLILDEPTSALDPNAREDFYALLSELNQKFQTTILLVSHDISSMGKYAKKMLYLDKKLIFFGDFEEFCHSEKMTQFFGFASQHQICWRKHNGNISL